MALKKEGSAHPVDKIAAYDKLISNLPGMERKGATMPYTSVNGNMFSYIEKDGSFGLRLPITEREIFLKQYKTSLFVSFGMVMKEYVLVPEKLFFNTKALQPWFKKSFEYTMSLKAKPSKKK
jgi:hypothetical protein